MPNEGWILAQSQRLGTVVTIDWKSMVACGEDWQQKEAYVKVQVLRATGYRASDVGVADEGVRSLTVVLSARLWTSRCPRSRFEDCTCYDDEAERDSNLGRS